MAASISVIVPAFNAGKYIGEAIESALHQIPAPAEILVVDDGSTDDTAAVAAGYGLGVTLLRQANSGIGAARNLAISRARGSLIALLDADDRWLPGKLAAQLAVLEARPEIDLVFVGIRQFLSPDVEASAERRASVAIVSIEGCLPSALLARRTAVDRVGAFRTDLRMGEFIDWYARALEAPLLSAIVPEILVERRVHATNTGARERNHRMDYVRVVKAALDRRRMAEGGTK